MRLFQSLSVILVCTCGLPLAHADIYTWVDKNGTTNVSNLTPPDGVDVKRVVKETPRSATSSPTTTTDVVPRAEVEFLAARVQQLEQEVALAQRPPPPPVVYPSIPAPPPIQYTVVSADASVNVMPTPSYGCDPTWLGCGGWFGLGYPAGIVVLGGNEHFRRPFPGRGHGPQFGGQQFGGNLFGGHRPASPPWGMARR